MCCVRVSNFKVRNSWLYASWKFAAPSETSVLRGLPASNHRATRATHIGQLSLLLMNGHSSSRGLSENVDVVYILLSEYIHHHLSILLARYAVIGFKYCQMVSQIGEKGEVFLWCDSGAAQTEGLEFTDDEGVIILDASKSAAEGVEL